MPGLITLEIYRAGRPSDAFNLCSEPSDKHAWPVPVKIIYCGLQWIKMTGTRSFIRTLVFIKYADVKYTLNLV